MRNKIAFLTALIILLVSILLVAQINRAETQAPKTIEDKVDILLQKQDEILKRLDQIVDELQKIKVRVSRL